LTAVASLYQTRVITNQLSSSVWPYLEIALRRETTTSRLELAIRNDGLGPAIIRTVVLTDDGKPVHDLGAFLKTAMGSLKRTHISMTSQDLSPGLVIRPGESVKFFDITSPVLVPRIEAALPRARLTVCYCSLLEECWSIHSDSTTDYPQKMARCAPPGSDELRYTDPLAG
jgi:hypothetical protein